MYLLQKVKAYLLQRTTNYADKAGILLKSLVPKNFVRDNTQCFAINRLTFYSPSLSLSYAGLRYFSSCSTYTFKLPA